MSWPGGETLFHIVAIADWVVAVERRHYAPKAFALEGFIHLSRRQQVIRPANLLYRGRNDLLLLVIDPDKLEAEVVYEPGTHGEDELFPHLYGMLNVDAVVATVEFRPGVDGSFVLPESLD